MHAAARARKLTRASQALASVELVIVFASRVLARGAVASGARASARGVTTRATLQRKKQKPQVAKDESAVCAKSKKNKSAAALLTPGMLA